MRINTDNPNRWFEILADNYTWILEEHDVHMGVSKKTGEEKEMHGVKPFYPATLEHAFQIIYYTLVKDNINCPDANIKDLTKDLLKIKDDLIREFQPYKRDCFTRPPKTHKTV